MLVTVEVARRAGDKDFEILRHDVDQLRVDFEEHQAEFLLHTKNFSDHVLQEEEFRVRQELTMQRHGNIIEKMGDIIKQNTIAIREQTKINQELTKAQMELTKRADGVISLYEDLSGTGRTIKRIDGYGKPLIRFTMGLIALIMVLYGAGLAIKDYLMSLSVLHGGG